MLAISDAVLSAWLSPARQLRGRIKVKDTMYESEEFTSLSFDSGSISGETYQIGSTYMNTVKVVFPSILEEVAEDVEIVPEIAVLVDDEYHYTKLGHFYVTEFDRDRNTNTTTLTASDKMIYMEGIYTSKLTFPKSYREVALEVANLAGVEVDETSFATLQNLSIAKPEGYTHRQAIGLIAQFEGGFASFNRDGELEIRRLRPTDFEVTPESYLLKGFSKNENAYRIGGITVRIGEEETDVLRVGSTNGSQIELENKVMTQTLLNNIWDLVKNLNYFPFELKWRGCPLLEAGDWMYVADRDGKRYSVPNLSYSLNFNGGLSGDSKATTNSSSQATYKYRGTLKQRVDWLDSILSANNWNSNYYDATEPPNPKEGDIWFKPNGQDTEIWIYEKDEEGNLDWVFKISTATDPELLALIEENKRLVEEAQKAAEDAQKAGEDAQKVADEAKEIGQAAQDKANSAAGDASQALTNANNAVNKATDASAKADQSSAAATQAQTDATTAINNADQAKTNAQDALSKAGQADATSNQAKSDAAGAVSTAQEAGRNANAALTNANQAIGDATNALAQSALAKSQAEEAINKYLGMGMSPAWSWSADGTDRFTTGYPGENLLAGTADYSYGIKGANTVVLTGDDGYNGHAVIKTTISPTDLSYIDSWTYRVPEALKAGTYTLSFKAKASIDGASISSYFYNPNTTTSSENSQGFKSSLTDGTSLFTLTTEWETYWITWKQRETASPKQAILVRIRRGDVPLDVYITEPKFESGINHDYIYTPASSEDYENAVPSYIGFAIEPSDNPADYTWIRNPEKVEGEVKVELTEINGELSRKVSQETFDQLNGTVINQSTLISQNQKNIQAKADQTLVDTINQTVTDNSTAIDLNSKAIALKANQSTVDSLTGRVTTAEGSIDVLAGQVALKANKTDVDTIAGRVSSAESQLTVQAGKITGLSTLTDGHTTQIGSLQSGYDGLSSTVSKVQEDMATASEMSNLTQTVDSISATVTANKTEADGKFSSQQTAINANTNSIKLKANQSTVDTLTGRVSTAEGSIDVLTGQVALKANQSTVDTLTNTVNAHSSELTVQAGKITGLTSVTDGHTSKIGALELQAGQFSLSLSEVQSDLDGMEIGGRNYFRHQDIVNLAIGGTILAASIYRGWYMAVKAGETYSMQRFGQTNNRFCYVFTKTEPGPGVPWIAGNYPSQNLVEKAENIKIPEDANYIFIYLSNQASEIPNIKVEKGSRATDWTPAPEDMATVTSLTEVKATVDSLTMTVADKADKTTVTQLANQWQQTTDLANGHTSQISSLGDAINLRVQKGDVINQINISPESILIAGQKVHITGQTTIDSAVIKTAHIADLAVNTAKIANLAVSEAKIGNLAVSSAKIADAAITSAKIGTAAIGTAHIGDGVITTAKIGSLSADKITAGTLNAANVNLININAGSITTGILKGITIQAVDFKGENMTLTGAINLDYTYNESSGVDPRRFNGTWTIQNNYIWMRGTETGVSDSALTGYFETYIGGDVLKFRRYTNATSGVLKSRVDVHSSRLTITNTWNADDGFWAGPNGYANFNNLAVNGQHGVISKDGVDIGFYRSNQSTTIGLYAKDFVKQSQLSAKTNISELDQQEALDTLLGTDIMLYQYKSDVGTDEYHASVIIDDIHDTPIYRTPYIFTGADMRGRDDGTVVGYLVQAVKALHQKIKVLEEKVA